MENKQFTLKEIERDQQVFEYVNDMLSPQARSKFSEILASDSELQKLVEQERKLSSTIQLIDKSETVYEVPESNLDKILPRLKTKKQMQGNWYGVAAALAVTLVSMGLWNNYNAPKFETLSNSTNVPVIMENNSSIEYSITLSNPINLLDENLILSEYGVQLRLNENGSYSLISDSKLDEKTWQTLATKGIRKN